MRANLSDNNISQKDNIVNNYDMQQDQKNTKFPIPQDPTKESSYDFLPQQIVNIYFINIISIEQNKESLYLVWLILTNPQKTIII
ncbi:MAG: hypothetical protein PHY00_04830 [Bacilli bacterium]|nr:hypothetical protein [Bacilli bacterium]